MKRPEPSTSEIPVVILCGGMGIRLKEETEARPKPMVEIGDQPILLHILTGYANHGFRRFILCLGFRGEVIKDYFCSYDWRTNDVEVILGARPQVRVLGQRPTQDWRVTLADTGLQAMTGARLSRVSKYVDTENFLLTYGDAVSDVDLGALYQFHRQHGRIGTVTGVRALSRFGELEAEGNRVTRFAEKPSGGGLINGGFFAFRRAMFDYVGEQDDCVLEREPLERLAADGELMVRPHFGFWQCMDTMRDVLHLRALYEKGERPWLNPPQRERVCGTSVMSS